LSVKIPDRLHIKKSYEKDFKDLLEKDSPLSKKGNKHIFIMGMVMGFYNVSRVPLDKKEQFVRIEYLNDDDKSLIKAIAINEENDLNILLDEERVYSIAEEYASGGIKYLKEMVLIKEYGSFIKKFETYLLDKFNKLKLGKNE